MADVHSSLLKSLQIPRNLEQDGYEQHATKAEAALTRLAGHTSGRSSQLKDVDDDSLLLLTAYTDPSNPWTTSSAAHASLSLLSALPSAKTSRFIVDTVLQRHLRPIFSKTTSKVTSSGRPSQYPEQDARVTEAATRGGIEEPAWKTGSGLTAVSTFAWAVDALESDLIKANWPLFTPVLLTLLEDRDNSIRVKGLQILIKFLNKCPKQVLIGTGIGTVFQEAVLPTVLFLPSLTPEAESVMLLRPAYTALLALAKVDEDPRSLGRRRQLDKMLRDGVFAAHLHASEYVHIVEVLMDVTADIVSALGIFAAKHLQNILPMISSVMTDPFAAAHGAVILASAKALNTCVRQCWPRMSDDDRTGQITRIISLCWLHMHSGQTGVKVPQALIADIEEELKLTAEMLHVLRQERGLGLLPEIPEIVLKEPRLKGLLTISTTSSP